MTNIPYEILKELVVNGIMFKYLSFNYKAACAELDSINNTTSSNYYVPPIVQTSTGIILAHTMNTSTGSVRVLPMPNGTTSVHKLSYSCSGIPDEIKNNHIVWRTGKLREIKFNRNGEMYKFYIGNKFKFSKLFFIDDFGVKVKPILFKSDDKYDLIGQGLAIEETI